MALVRFVSGFINAIEAVVASSDLRRDPGPENKGKRVMHLAR